MHPRLWQVFNIIDYIFAFYNCKKNIVLSLVLVETFFPDLWFLLSLVPMIFTLTCFCNLATLGCCCWQKLGRSAFGSITITCSCWAFCILLFDFWTKIECSFVPVWGIFVDTADCLDHQCIWQSEHGKDVCCAETCKENQNQNLKIYQTVCKKMRQKEQ